MFFIFIKNHSLPLCLGSLCFFFFAEGFWFQPCCFSWDFNREFFPIRLSGERISPSLERNRDGFGVDFEFFCRGCKGKKILFFCVVIPQNANCRKNWFLPRFQPLDFHFSFWRLNNPRSFFPQNFCNGIWRNSEFQCKISFGQGFDVCSAGNKVCFLNCDYLFSIKRE